MSESLKTPFQKDIYEAFKAQNIILNIDQVLRLSSKDLNLRSVDEALSYYFSHSLEIQSIQALDAQAKVTSSRISTTTYSQASSPPLQTSISTYPQSTSPRTYAASIQAIQAIQAKPAMDEKTSTAQAIDMSPRTSTTTDSESTSPRVYATTDSQSTSPRTYATSIQAIQAMGETTSTTSSRTYSPTDSEVTSPQLQTSSTSSK